MTLWIATCGKSVFKKSEIEEHNQMPTAEEINLVKNSAELSGLDTTSATDTVVLLASDTDVGRRAAALVEGALLRKMPDVTVQVIPNLDPKEKTREQFETSMVDLGVFIDSAITIHKTHVTTPHVTVLLSGGYKSVAVYIPILLSLVASKHEPDGVAFDVRVQYEEATDYIELPMFPLPVTQVSLAVASLQAGNTPETIVEKLAAGLHENITPAEWLRIVTVLQYENGVTTPLGQLAKKIFL
jgi:CRISPR/Cas system-associated protein Csm6